MYSREQESGSQVTKRLVNQLLTELDGFEVNKDKLVSCVLVVLYKRNKKSRQKKSDEDEDLTGALNVAALWFDPMIWAGVCHSGYEPTGYDRQRHVTTGQIRQARCVLFFASSVFLTIAPFPLTYFLVLLSCSVLT